MYLWLFIACFFSSIKRLINFSFSIFPQASSYPPIMSSTVSPAKTTPSSQNEDDETPETCSWKCIFPTIVILSLSVYLYYEVGVLIASPWYPSAYDQIQCIIAKPIITKYTAHLHGLAASTSYDGWKTQPGLMKLPFPDCFEYSESCKPMEDQLKLYAEGYDHVFPGIRLIVGDPPTLCEHAKIRQERIPGHKYFSDSMLSIFFPVIPGVLLLSAKGLLSKYFHC